MDDRLSALADGELPDEEANATFNRLKSCPNLRSEWHTCHLIGDALRDTPSLNIDMTARVMESLLDEPVVLAPRTSPARPVLRNMMAIAASVAGVAVVSAVAWSGRQAPAGVVAQSSIAAAKAAATVLAANGMQEYLVAHQTHAPVNLMQGGTRYVRTVALASEQNAR